MLNISHEVFTAADHTEKINHSNNGYSYVRFGNSSN